MCVDWQRCPVFHGAASALVLVLMAWAHVQIFLLLFWHAGKNNETCNLYWKVLGTKSNSAKVSVTCSSIRCAKTITSFISDYCSILELQWQKGSPPCIPALAGVLPRFSIHALFSPVLSSPCTESGLQDKFSSLETAGFGSFLFYLHRFGVLWYLVQNLKKNCGSLYSV